MKPQLFIHSFMVLIPLFVMCNVNAQQTAMSKSAEKNPELLKNVMIADEPTITSKISKLNKVRLHALNDFNSKYKSVTDASWYQTANGFVAKFNSSNAAATVAYNNNGKWLYTFRTYDEKNMPNDVRSLVKSTYYDYSIMNIKEIEVPREDSKTFLVYVQDTNNIKVLRIHEGVMEVLQEYSRG